MKKFLKITAIVIAVLLTVLIAGPMAFKGKITDIVKTEANKMLKGSLDFEALNLSLFRHFPHASIEIKGLELTADENFGNEAIVCADRISAVVDLMSLFGDSGIEITKVYLEKPLINAVKKADGTVNWDIMKEIGEKETEENVPEENIPEEKEASELKLQVKDFRIIGADIRYADDSSSLYVETAPLSLALKGDLSAEKTQLKLSLELEKVKMVSGEIDMANDISLHLNADIAADLGAKHFTFADNSLGINDITLKLDGWAALRENGMEMDLKAGFGEVGFKDILSLIPAFYTKDFKNLSADGSLGLELWAKGELSKNKLPEFLLAASIKDGSFKYAALPEGVTGIGMDLKISNPGSSMDKTVADLKHFGLTMAGNTIDASLYATELTSDPYASIGVKGRFDLGAVKKVYPLDEGMSLAGLFNADLKAAGHLSYIEKQHYERLDASGMFTVEGVDVSLPDIPAVHVNRAEASITPLYMDLGELDVQVGNSDLQAKGRISDYLAYLLRKETLHGELDLQSSMLDLNEFMTSTEEVQEETSGETKEETPASGEDVKDETGGTIAVPANLDLRLTTILKEIRLQKMNITNVAGAMSVKNGTLSLEGLHLNAFEGTATASGSYSTAEDIQRPSVKMALAFKDASFKQTFEQLELVRKMIPIFEKTGGNYSLETSIETRLDNKMSPELMTLSANGEIRSEKIDIQKIEAFDKLATILKDDRLRDIHAKDVRISFRIKDGRIVTKPFDLKMGDVNINLNGSTGLDQSIDYVATATLPDTGTQLIKNIPIVIKGTFSDPEITVDLKSAVKETTDKIVDHTRKEVGKAVDKAEEQIDKAIDKKKAEAAEKLRQGARKAGDKLIEAAQKERDKMYEKAAGQKPIARKLTEKAADKLVEEARKKAEALLQEAEAKIAAEQE